MKKVVGILALQGSFAEHGQMLDSLEQDFIWVRTVEDLELVTHLVVPGGESTTLRILLGTSGMWEVFSERMKSKDLCYFGTCAGSILGSDFVDEIKVERNAYGAQQASFIDTLESDLFKDFQGVFIRAPRFGEIDSSVNILASFKNDPVLVQKDNILLATFHPEMTEDGRVHEYFLNRVISS